MPGRSRSSGRNSDRSGQSMSACAGTTFSARLLGAAALLVLALKLQGCAEGTSAGVDDGAAYVSAGVAPVAPVPSYAPPYGVAPTSPPPTPAPPPAPQGALPPGTALTFPPDAAPVAPAYPPGAIVPPPAAPYYAAPVSPYVYYPPRYYVPAWRPPPILVPRPHRHYHRRHWREHPHHHRHDR